MRARAFHPKPPRSRGLNEAWAGNILPFPRKSPDFFWPPYPSAPSFPPSLPACLSASPVLPVRPPSLVVSFRPCDGFACPSAFDPSAYVRPPPRSYLPPSSYILPYVLHVLPSLSAPRTFLHFRSVFPTLVYFLARPLPVAPPSTDPPRRSAKFRRLRMIRGRQRGRRRCAISLLSLLPGGSSSRISFIRCRRAKLLPAICPVGGVGVDDRGTAERSYATSYSPNN